MRAHLCLYEVDRYLPKNDIPKNLSHTKPTQACMRAYRGGTCVLPHSHTFSLTYARTLNVNVCCCLRRSVRAITTSASNAPRVKKRYLHTYPCAMHNLISLLYCHTHMQNAHTSHHTKHHAHYTYPNTHMHTYTSAQLIHFHTTQCSRDI